MKTFNDVAGDFSYTDGREDWKPGEWSRLRMDEETAEWWDEFVKAGNVPPPVAAMFCKAISIEGDVRYYIYQEIDFTIEPSSMRAWFDGNLREHEERIARRMEQFFWRLETAEERRSGSR